MAFILIFFFLVYPFSFSSVWQHRALWQSGTDLNCNLSAPSNPGFLSQQTQYSILSLCAEDQAWGSENSSILEIHLQVSPSKLLLFEAGGQMQGKPPPPKKSECFMEEKEFKPTVWTQTTQRFNWKHTKEFDFLLNSRHLLTASNALILHKS